MARKKTAADELYNIRRRYQRQAARLEKEVQSGKLDGLEAKAALNTANQLKNFAKGLRSSNLTKIGKSINTAVKEYKEASLQVLGSISTTRETVSEQVLQGGAGKLFYAATVTIWQGLPEKDRNSAIIKAMNATDLLDAIKKVQQITDLDLIGEEEGKASKERYDALTMRKAWIKMNRSGALVA